MKISQVWLTITDDLGDERLNAICKLCFSPIRGLKPEYGGIIGQHDLMEIIITLIQIDHVCSVLSEPREALVNKLDNALQEIIDEESNNYEAGGSE
jgi:hypothetical protein